MDAPKNVLPFARFSPVSGIFVDRTEVSVSIRGAMEVYGPEASNTVARTIQDAINTTWTATFPDGYSCSCSIVVTYRSDKSPAGSAGQIEAVKTSSPSHVNALTRSMTLNANEQDAFTWTPAHEFGHVIGLKDRYSEGIMSSIAGSFGGTRTTVVDPRYQANLMAVDKGTLESQNLKDLAIENEPSPYWINDDDEVRDWLGNHPLPDVTALPTAAKLKAIQTLMTGWISSDDLAAICRICSSVVTAVEANAIRKGIDPIGFSDLGQRTTFRVALVKMPS